LRCTSCAAAAAEPLLSAESAAAADLRRLSGERKVEVRICVSGEQKGINNHLIIGHRGDVACAM
jgi:hypothetical protein